MEYYNKLCKCGCGGKIPVKAHHKNYSVPDYIYSHNLKAYHGKLNSELTREKISLANKGRHSWDIIHGKEKADELRKKCSERFKGKSYDEMYGKEKGDVLKKNRSDSNIGRKVSDNVRIAVAKANKNRI